ncbi:MAG: DUF4145 domain-containing protein [Candidatus Thermoplasmatota archaeon]|nr:DUF4145 domain-containing protein [Candidatus Thermoplasmatota archaeon]
MVDEAEILLNIATTLLDTTINAYKNRNVEFYNYAADETNKITLKIKQSAYKSPYDFQQLYHSSYPDQSDLMKIISNLRMIVSFLDNVTGNKDKKIERLNSENAELRKEMKNTSEKEKEYLEIIKQSRSKSDYIVSDDQIAKFDGNNMKLINEALDSYSIGAYTACICVCRNILQDMVNKLCAKNNISEGSLKSQIEKLVENGIIKSDHHGSMLTLSKFFGIRAAHPTTEVLNKEKANLVLSSIFIINEELFSTI